MFSFWVGVANGRFSIVAEKTTFSFGFFRFFFAEARRGEGCVADLA